MIKIERKIKSPAGLRPLRTGLGCSSNDRLEEVSNRIQLKFCLHWREDFIKISVMLTGVCVSRQRLVTTLLR